MIDDKRPVEEMRIENAQNLADAAVYANRHFDGTNSWWRGHSLSSWALRPSIYRVEDSGYRYEQNIANLFIQKSRMRHQNTPSETDIPGWFFLMQHYGLPTRILDWTESILFATYFAVRDEKYHDKDGALWALDGANLNEDQFDRHSFASVGDSPVSTLFREALRGTKGEPTTVVAAISSKHVDTRMMVQLAQFTIHGTADPIEKLPNNEKFLAKMIVPSSAKKSLKALLGLFGISEATLFPDLEHLAKELRGLRFLE